MLRLTACFQHAYATFICDPARIEILETALAPSPNAGNYIHPAPACESRGSAIAAKERGNLFVFRELKTCA